MVCLICFYQERILKISTHSLAEVSKVYNFDVSNIYIHIWICSILINLSGDIEKNSRPKPISCDKFSICHWNLNSISAHNFIKISLLRAYVSTQYFDILCLSETYLDSSISSNDSNLTIPGYDLYRADDPSNVKRVGGGAGAGRSCIYCKNFLPLKVIDI